MHSGKIVRVSLISFILLFLELLFIRLVGTEIRIFAYVSNLVLLTVFIGSSAGIFIKRRLSLESSVVCMTLLTGGIAFHVFSDITTLVAPFSDSFIWYSNTTATMVQITWGITQILFLFFVISLVFAPIGQYLGEVLSGNKHPVIFYSMNLIFSVIGMWVFYLFSFVNISPYVGILVAELLIIVLIPSEKRRTSLIFVGITLLCVLVSMPKTITVWSPYQKLSVEAEKYNDIMPNQKTISVNNVGYMSILDLSKQNTDRYKIQLIAHNIVSPSEINFQNLYDVPYLLKPEARDALIIGVGGGNDAAAALRASVRRVDAVEIDPQIIALGTQYHPEHPYTDKRVHIVIDDGRSFIRKSKERYDVIVMGFVDSHTTNSTMTNIQLDNYLYTVESFREVKNILKADGILYLFIDVPRVWMGERLQQTLTAAFGQKPLVFSLDSYFSGGGTVFIAGKDQNKLQEDVLRVSGLKQFIDKRKISYDNRTNILTDDWPYLYLKNQHVPMLHVIIACVLLAVFLLFGKRISLYSQFHWTSFFLGAGFLLYEFQNITKTSLLFGNTWITNLYTITGILLLALLANMTYLKHRVPLWISYVFLFLSFVLEVAIPTSYFSALPYGWRVLVAIFFLNAPLFFSSLIFISVFTRSTNRKSVLASNFLGSFVGGVLSFLSYAFGLHALLFVGMILYGLSFLFLNRTITRRFSP